MEKEGKEWREWTGRENMREWNGTVREAKEGRGMGRIDGG